MLTIKEILEYKKLSKLSGLYGVEQFPINLKSKYGKKHSRPSTSFERKEISGIIYLIDSDDVDVQFICYEKSSSIPSKSMEDQSITNLKEKEANDENYIGIKRLKTELEDVKFELIQKERDKIEFDHNYFVCNSKIERMISYVDAHNTFWIHSWNANYNFLNIILNIIWNPSHTNMSNKNVYTVTSN